MPRKVIVEGTTIIVPDDATPDEIDEVYKSKQPPTTAPAAEEQSFFTRGLVPPEFLSAVTGHTPEQLREIRDLPPSAEPGGDLPSEAFGRTLVSGIAGDVAETVSSLTSPLSLGTLGLGKIARMGGKLSALARTLLTTSGVGFGVAGGVQAGEALESDLPLPEKTQATLLGLSQVVSAAPAARTAAGAAHRATVRARNIGRVPPEQALASSIQQSTKVDATAEIAAPIIRDVRATAAKLGMTPESLKGPNGPDNLVRLATETKHEFQNQYGAAKRTYLEQAGDKQIPTKAIGLEVLSKITEDMKLNKPKMAEALRKEASKWLLGRDSTGRLQQGQRSFSSLEETRVRLNQEVRQLETASSSGQIKSLKTNAKLIAVKAQRDAVRELIYGELQKANPDLDIAAMKRKESATIDFEEGANLYRNQVKNQQARFVAPGPGEAAEQSATKGITFKNVKIPFFNALLKEFGVGSPERSFGSSASRILSEPPIKMPTTGRTPLGFGGLLQAIADAAEERRKARSGGQR